MVLASSIMDISETLCDLHDIKKFLELHNLFDNPKDNDGSGFTIGDVIVTLEQFVISLYGGEHKIPTDMQEKIDDWKTSMAFIREGLGLPSEVDKENNK